MIPLYRKQFNDAFSENKYQQYLNYFDVLYPNAVAFRIAETPIFISEKFKNELLEVGTYVCSQIQNPNFNAITNKSLQNTTIAPHEKGLPECIVMDFAIAYNEQNQIVPALIELQGFPSLFAFEILQDKALRNSYSIPDNVTPYLNDYTQDKYLAHLSNIIKGDNQGHTILLELFPQQQKTRIDFLCTEHFLNIPTVCITEIYKKEQHLYYVRNGHEIKIDRIYNRIVSDELKNQPKEIKEKAAILNTDLAVEWVTHPNHFFRISKYLLPYLNHKYIPKTQFVSELNTYPNHLEKYILKPLFSFAGQGVIIDVEADHFTKINDPDNWILQEKVNYAPCIETPDGFAKAEIRLFYFWDKTNQKYIATLNLCRLSKGKMIGVNYNQTATWVGGSLAYFEK
ncbi:MAG: hypothetical protein ACR2IM_05230 [Sediminibacterium sp.]|jgi:hypothetical protein